MIKVVKPRQAPAPIRMTFCSEYSKAADRQRQPQPCPSAKKPGRVTAMPSIGLRQWKFPVSEFMPIKMASPGTTAQIMKNVQQRHIISASHSPLKHFWMGLPPLILEWAPNKACFANSPRDVSLRATCRYHVAIAIFICPFDTLCSVPPIAKATWRTYSASSIDTSRSLFSRCNASRNV